MSQDKSKFKNERRRLPRLNVQIWAVELNENSRYYHMLSNLSVGGFFIEKKLPFSVGSIIDFEMELDGEIISFKGKIVNNYEGADSNHPGAGVQFVDLDEKAKDKIEAYLKKLEK
ncbi:MAG: PilZ domain-containing protein [Deltaproteobacteria bacterium]|nr:PilZ domain-containing protein [Deltaproteobacteria bacterium]